MARPVMHAFIDEAGDRSRKPSASDHFVMSAVVFPDSQLPRSALLLADLRTEIERRPGDVLHWRNFSHSVKLHVAQRLSQEDWLTVSSVVVCKRHLTGGTLNDDQAYLYTLRFLLERLSWFARDLNHDLTYTLAHVVRFKIAKLRQYEEALKHTPGCQIAWSSLVPGGGKIDQPNRLEQLQLADIAASATFQAFEPDKFSNTEARYLTSLRDRLYRRGSAPLTSYGLKIHPWNHAVRAAYPWVAAL